jgi:hypothetical protein
MAIDGVNIEVIKIERIRLQKFTKPCFIAKLHIFLIVDDVDSTFNIAVNIEWM